VRPWPWPFAPKCMRRHHALRLVSSFERAPADLNREGDPVNYEWMTLSSCLCSIPPHTSFDSPSHLTASELHSVPWMRRPAAQDRPPDPIASNPKAVVMGTGPASHARHQPYSPQHAAAGGRAGGRNRSDDCLLACFLFSAGAPGPVRPCPRHIVVLHHWLADGNVQRLFACRHRTAQLDTVNQPLKPAEQD
jgi:hypothetical protein